MLLLLIYFFDYAAAIIDISMLMRNEYMYY